jgi:hypothetical protein
MDSVPIPTTLDVLIVDENVDRVKVLSDQKSFLALSYHLQEGKKRGSLYYGKVEDK